MHLFTYYNMRHLVLTWDENSTTFGKMYILSQNIMCSKFYYTRTLSRNFLTSKKLNLQVFYSATRSLYFLFLVGRKMEHLDNSKRMEYLYLWWIKNARELDVITLLHIDDHRSHGIAWIPYTVKTVKEYRCTVDILVRTYQTSNRDQRSLLFLT